MLEQSVSEVVEAALKRRGTVQAPPPATSRSSSRLNVRRSDRTSKDTDDRHAVLTILQMNDLHGYLEPHPEVFRGRGRFDYRTCGGLARIASIFTQVRAERPGEVLALDNGDTFHGTYVAVQSPGEALLPLMNALGIRRA